MLDTTNQKLNHTFIYEITHKILRITTREWHFAISHFYFKYY